MGVWQIDTICHFFLKLLQPLTLISLLLAALNSAEQELSFISFRLL